MRTTPTSKQLHSLHNTERPFEEDPMRALFIGGTGTISSEIVRQLSLDSMWEVWVLNRGNRSVLPQNVHSIVADIRNEQDAAKKLADMNFDVVCEFIGFNEADVARDFRLFAGRTRQYMYISSASAYHKPAASPFITEGTTLANPYWQYSRDKIACENYLMQQYRSAGFPVTIIRPSHTYDERHLPLALHGKNGFWQVIRRMQENKPVIIHGDGSSLWHLTFNRDFAVGFIGLMGNPQAIGEAFQITGNELLTWNQIHTVIADALGVSLNIRHISSDFLAAAGKKYGYDFEGSLIGDKATSVIFDNSKLKRLVPAMTTTVPFSRGARIALDYILSHPAECQIEDPAFDAWCDRVIAAVDLAQSQI